VYFGSVSPKVFLLKIQCLPEKIDTQHCRLPTLSIAISEAEINNMFPTHVGMNRIAQRRRWSSAYVPHTRGDEPTLTGVKTDASTCSPQSPGGGWGWLGRRDIIID